MTSAAAPVAPSNPTSRRIVAGSPEHPGKIDNKSGVCQHVIYAVSGFNDDEMVRRQRHLRRLMYDRQWQPRAPVVLDLASASAMEVQKFSS